LIFTDLANWTGWSRSWIGFKINRSSFL